MSEKPVDENYVKLARIVKLSDDLDKIKSILKSDFNVNYSVPSNGRTALHFAVVRVSKVYHLNVCKLLIKRGVDFTLKDHNGLTPLRLAFEFFKKGGGERFLFFHLIDIMLSVHLEFKNLKNPRCNNGISHLHIACFANNKKVVRFFLEAGVSVNEAINNDSALFPGYTLLHIAMRNKNKDMVQLLLEHGAEYNCLNAEQMTPLHLLDDWLFVNDSWMRYNKCFSNKSSKNGCILDLISQPDKNNFDPIDFIGLTELHTHCIRSCSLEVLEATLEISENVNSIVNFKSPVWPGYTALHFAVHVNQPMIVYLIDKGADLLAKDANDTMPLELCLKKFEPSVISSIMKTQKRLRSVMFKNGESLIDAVTSFDSEKALKKYLCNKDVNSAIPFDSPLWPGYTFLHLAAILLTEQENIYQIKLCSEQPDVDLTIKDANNMTALHLAAHKENWTFVRTLMDVPAKIHTNPVDDRHLSHFHLAFILKKIEVMKKFLQIGVDLNVPTRADVSLQHITDLPYLPAGSTPFHIAIAVKSNEVAQLLQQYKADPNLLDADCFSAFHRAFLRFDHDQLKRLLYQHFKAFKSNLVAPGKLSYLHVVCYVEASNNILKAVKSLLPLVENISEPLNSELLKYVKKLPKGIDLGDTPLHLAVKASSVKTVDHLLRHGADRGAKNEKGFNPIQLALLNRDAQKIIRCFLCDIKDEKKWLKTGLTRLHVACALGDINLIKELLEVGENVNSQIDLKSPMWPGYTPLHVLVREEYPKNDQIVKLLLNHILADTEKPLHAKCQKVMPLLEYKKLPVNDEGFSAFHVSCMGSDVDLVERFIRCGADINAPKDHFAKSDPGFSPLHFAVMYGSDGVLELLLKSGANVNAEDANGNAPLDLVTMKNFYKAKIFISIKEVCTKLKDSFGRLLVYLAGNHTSSDDFLYLLKHGPTKSIDVSTKLYLVKFIAQKFSTNVFTEFIKYMPNLCDVDENGRNIIHHVLIDEDTSVSIIETLLKYGCDIDHQDKMGRTPLHQAVINENFRKCKMLLSLGADVNIADFDGETLYIQLQNYKNDIDYLDDYFGKDFAMFDKHLKKIKAAGLYIHPTNEGYVSVNSLGSDESYNISFLKNIEITKSFSVRDVLREELVMKFPVMPRQQRQAIIDYIDTNDLRQNEELSEWVPLLKMQLRKALKRQALFDPALASLRNLLDPRLPLHCQESILINLSYEDWRNLTRI